MTHDEIIRMAREAGWKDLPTVRLAFAGFDLSRFAALVKQHLIEQGYRQCAKGQRTTQHCGLLEEAVRREREARAEAAYEFLDDPFLSGHGYATGCRDAIRARTNT